MTEFANIIPLATRMLQPGMRVAVACSGGADSVALLRTLMEQRGSLGIALSVAHMNHGIRGSESDEDEAFVAALASKFDLKYHHLRVNTPERAATERQGLEESARRLRYDWFWDLMATGEADAVVTAHTLDDQAETVLHRLMRGAWTEGLSGIFPELKPPGRQSGVILRPFLGTTRAEIEAWLSEIRQQWREDSTNRDLAFTRNRIRHELLPQLATFNPEIKRQFAQLAVLARDEEAYWQAELGRHLPSILLPGKAVRGGGRATGTLSAKDSVAIEVERLRPFPVALQRRIVRAAAGKLGCALNFDETERMLTVGGVASKFSGGQQHSSAKLELSNNLRAERTPRELRLSRIACSSLAQKSGHAITEEYLLPIPGSIDALEFGLTVEARIANPLSGPVADATLRASRTGDRVTLRYSRAALKIKEALQRARITPDDPHPVLEWRGEIVWVKGLEIESKLAKDAVLEIIAVPHG